jgi:predicted HD superfamily hydrolase involved in NAD metabolism
MIFDDSKVNILRESISTRLSTKRYIHTLGVEKTAIKLGELCLPDKISELRCAALLHDIAKEYDNEATLFFIKSNNFVLTSDDIDSPAILHSFAAPYLIKKDFPEYATDDILSACLKHTTGDSSMTVFDEIIFISDFIEDGRSYESCKEVREMFFSMASCKKSREENIRALHTAVIACIDKTIEHLTSKDRSINNRTLNAKNAITELLKAKDK